MVSYLQNAAGMDEYFDIAEIDEVISSCVSCYELVLFALLRGPFLGRGGGNRGKCREHSTFRLFSRAGGQTNFLSPLTTRVKFLLYKSTSFASKLYLISKPSSLREWMQKLVACLKTQIATPMFTPTLFTITAPNVQIRYYLLNSLPSST